MTPIPSGATALGSGLWGMLYTSRHEGARRVVRIRIVQFGSHTVSWRCCRFTYAELGAGMLAQIERIYVTSFPPEEREPVSVLADDIREGRAALYAAVEGPTVLGFGLTLPLTIKGWSYLPYLAVGPSRRGSGVGGQLFRTILEAPMRVRNVERWCGRSSARKPAPRWKMLWSAGSRSTNGTGYSAASGARLPDAYDDAGSRARYASSASDVASTGTCRRLSRAEVIYGGCCIPSWLWAGSHGSGGAVCAGHGGSGARADVSAAQCHRPSPRL